MLKTRKTMVSWQAFPSLPPRAPLAFLSHLKLPFPSLSNACHAGYMQVDLKSFLASGASFLGREATERATFSQVINSSFFTVRSIKPAPACRPDWATWTMFSVARGQVLRRIKGTAFSLRPPLHSELTFPSFADIVSFFGLCNPADLHVHRRCGQ